MTFVYKYTVLRFLLYNFRQIVLKNIWMWVRVVTEQIIAGKIFANMRGVGVCILYLSSISSPTPTPSLSLYVIIGRGCECGNGYEMPIGKERCTPIHHLSMRVRKLPPYPHPLGKLNVSTKLC